MANFELCVYNHKVTVGSSDRELFFSVEVKSQSYRVEIEKEHVKKFNEIVGMFDRYWIRTDFYSRYQVQDNVGKGGFASVSLVIRTLDGKLFAAKMIKKERIAREKERAYFIHELKVSRLLDHPRFAKTYEVHDIPTYFVIIMDYLEGANLLQYIKLKKKLSDTIALHIVREILIGLRYLHELGYVHRDIKPQNIMLKLIKEEKNLDFRDKYSVIIIDFGLCADYRNHTVTSFLHDKSGTTGYLAPEVIKNHKQFYNEKVDIFSLGVVFIEM